MTKINKFLIALLISMGFATASSALGLKIGTSAQLGFADASGSESENSTVESKATDNIFFGNYSFFVEKSLGFLPGPLSRLSVGYDFVPHDMGTGTAENVRTKSRNGGSGAIVAHNNRVKANFSDFNTIYATLNITDWLYLKAGTLSVDMTTKENLETGSSYGDAGLDGEMFGIGIEQSTDRMFFRVEGNWMDVDGVTLTSQTNSANTVTLDGIDTVSAKASIGFKF